MKKGIIFSIISVIIVVFFLFVFSTITRQFEEQSDDFFFVQAEAIGTYHDLLVDYYIPFTIEQAARNTFDVMLNFSAEESELLPKSEFSRLYRELMEKGKTNFTEARQGNTVFVLHELNTSGNRTLADWLNEFSVDFENENITLAEQTNLFQSRVNVEDSDVLSVTTDFSRLNFTHTTPWAVTVTAYVTIIMNTSEFEIKTKNKPISVDVSIIGMDNPVHLAHSEGNLSSLIDNSTEFINVWNISRLDEEIIEQRYFSNAHAPTYLSRFTNQTTPSKFGILSFINPDWIEDGSYFANYQTQVTRRNFVDYQFFEPTNCLFSSDPEDFLYNISGISNKYAYGFQLDLNNTVRYTGTDFGGSNTEPICGQSIS